VHPKPAGEPKPPQCRSRIAVRLDLPAHNTLVMGSTITLHAQTTARTHLTIDLRLTQRTVTRHTHGRHTVTSVRIILLYELRTAATTNHKGMATATFHFGYALRQKTAALLTVVTRPPCGAVTKDADVTVLHAPLRTRTH